MKKICGISIEDFATVRLVGETRNLTPEELRTTLNRDYHPLVTKDNEGVLVYMSDKEYEELTKGRA